MKTPVAVYCDAEFVSRVNRAFRCEVCINSDWDEFESTAEKADCLVVIKPNLSQFPELISCIRGLFQRLPLGTNVIVSNLTPQIVEALGSIEFHGFLTVDQVETDLVRRLEALDKDDRRKRVVKRISAIASSSLTRKAIAVALLHDPMPKSDAELSQHTQASVSHLRRCLRRELGLTVFELRRWARLLRAVGLRQNGSRWTEIALELGVDESTLARDMAALLTHSAIPNSDQVATSVARMLIGRVTDHSGGNPQICVSGG